MRTAAPSPARTHSHSTTRPRAAMATRAAASRLGRLSPSTTALFVCDVQERFSTGIRGFDAVADVAGRMAAAAGILDMPVIVTEQVPDKLGKTVPAITTRLPPSTPPAIPKKLFSMCLPDVMSRLAGHQHIQAVLITGIEAHVCVLQTTLDLLEAGFDVHIITDGVSSQRHADREAGLARAAAAGAFLSSSEMALFELARSADHPRFRDISALAKEPRRGGVLPGLHGAAALAAAEGASKL